MVPEHPITTGPLPEDVRTALDHQALRGLAERYAYHADRRDAGAVAALFTEDGVLVTPDVPKELGPVNERRGRTAIEEAIAGLASLRSTVHLVVGQVCEVEGDEAAGVTSCEAHHLSGEDGEVSDWTWMIRYRDRFRREPDGWRFSRRELFVEWVEQRSPRVVRPWDRGPFPASGG